jgi:alginate O-acetyltransferase complex protein AlgI
MIFNSFEFLWLFPIIFVVYYLFTNKKIINKYWDKLGNYFLLIISYLLYIKYKPIYALILLGITAITYLLALYIEKKRFCNKKKNLVILGIVLTLIPLLVFKYYNFINNSLTDFFELFGIKIGLPGLNWIIPLGISFFSLQAIGYLYDVYKGRFNAEHNWCDYMLFISFFPQIASGPISKAKDLLPQIKKKRQFNYLQAVQGLKWLLWGMFMKVVVADSLGQGVDLVYNDYSGNNGGTCFITALSYTFQIYCDFAGYSFMAVGVGEILGFELINNFRRPFLSQSITEFWHRWHISLSLWLKDYVYIPLGGSRCSKLKNYWNILVTFVVSGLWHGANWTFIFWGLIQGIAQIIEKFFGVSKIQSKGIIKFSRIILTYLIFSFSLIFFRLPTLDDSFNVIVKIFTDFSTNVSFASYWCILIFVVSIKDIIDEYEIKSLKLLHSKYLLIRWFTYIVLVSWIAISGVYGGHFIYSGF